MKTNNGEIYVTKSSLQKLVEVEEMPAKFGIKILKMAKKLNEEIGLIEQARNTLIKKYGDEKDGKISITPTSEGFVKFVEEMNEMMAVDVNLDVEKVQVPDSVTMSIKDLAALEPFIEIIELK